MFWGCHCCNRLQIVADASGGQTGLQMVHKTVAIGCKTKKSEIQCPGVPPPFPYKLRSKIPIMSTVATPQPRQRKSRSAMVHLRLLSSVQPATSMGKVIAAWNEIEAGLAQGMKLREVWEAARLDGLEIPYPQFRVYVSRLRRRRERSEATKTPPRRASTANPDDALSAPPLDPFRNLREEREKGKQSGFEYDPFSINKKLI